MSTVNPERVVQHADPVRRAEANYIAFIALDDHGVPGWLEQIWAQRLTGDTFRLCCIPFFTYGFALGDSIEIRSVDGVQLVTRRIEPSGHTAVRLMANDKTRPGIHEEMHDVVVPLRLPFEWQSAGFVAIDAATPEQREQIEEAVAPLIESGHYVLELGVG